MRGARALGAEQTRRRRREGKCGGVPCPHQREGVEGAARLGEGGVVTEAALRALRSGCDYYILVVAVTQNVRCVCV